MCDVRMGMCSRFSCEIVSDVMMEEEILILRQVTREPVFFFFKCPPNTRICACTYTHTYIDTGHHHRHRGSKAHNWTEVSVDNEARPHTCQTLGISLDWPLKSSSLCGSGGQESE